MPTEVEAAVDAMENSSPRLAQDRANILVEGMMVAAVSKMLQQGDGSHARILDVLAPPPVVP